MTSLIPTNRTHESNSPRVGLRSFPSFSSWIDDMLNSSFGSEFMSNFNSGMTLPAVNVLEFDDKYLVEMAVPGFKKSDFNVNLDNKVLTISAELKHENEEEIKDSYTRKEFGYSSFQRTFTIPDTVDGDKILAKYEDGILKVALPKIEEAKKKPAKTIKIS